MAIQVTIDTIAGLPPFDIYICQSNGTGCFYISTIESTPYVFDIPEPYDNATTYQLKVIDGNNCTITGIESI